MCRQLERAQPSWSILIPYVNLCGVLHSGSCCMVVPVPAHGEGLYITAKEAAAELGVSIPTLYAYVSRGLIRSQGVAGSRNRRYWKVDIERLRGRRGPHEHSQGQPGAGEEAKGLVAETKITLLTERGLYYRGRDVVELAETETFESV